MVRYGADIKENGRNNTPVFPINDYFRNCLPRYNIMSVYLDVRFKVC